MPAPSPTVRIDPIDHEVLRDLAGRMDTSMSEVLHRALQRLRREFILESTNSVYAALKSNESAWAEELRDRDAWDATAADGARDD